MLLQLMVQLRGSFEQVLDGSEETDNKLTSTEHDLNHVENTEMQEIREVRMMEIQILQKIHQILRRNAPSGSGRIRMLRKRKMLGNRDTPKIGTHPR